MVRRSGARADLRTGWWCGNRSVPPEGAQLQPIGQAEPDSQFGKEMFISPGRPTQVVREGVARLDLQPPLGNDRGRRCEARAIGVDRAVVVLLGGEGRGKHVKEAVVASGIAKVRLVVRRSWRKGRARIGGGHGQDRKEQGRVGHRRRIITSSNRSGPRPASESASIRLPP